MILRTLHNCEPCNLGEVPLYDNARFRKEILEAIDLGGRVSALFAYPEHDPCNGATATGEKTFLMTGVIAFDEMGTIGICSTKISGPFESLTPVCPQVHLFEREVWEQTGCVPIGHPWLKPVRFVNLWDTIGITNFFRLEGDEAHEVAVGPVHAGIIEPGHFRFQCHGENVYHLEISLGYQHRGNEKHLLGGPDIRSIHYIETLAGDTTAGHAFAYAQVVESLEQTGFRSPRAMALRGIALELERCANHTGDLGALAGDVGYLPTQSYCGRIRGDFLNMTALLCGNRFGRSMIIPGGVAFDADDARVKDLLHRIDKAEEDVASAVDLLWNSSTVLARFENTGIVTEKACREIGLVGPAARACGVNRDVRVDFPSGIYRFNHIPASGWDSGDVFSRAYVRWLEIGRSIEFIRQQAATLPGGDLRKPQGKIKPNQIAISLVEGWRGEICHVAITDSSGKFRSYKIVDPSFHNWFGLALSLRNQQISDFPLCNKSFNLSYCGFDL